MRQLIFCFYFLCIHKVFSQVINIESKRFHKDTNGLVGRVDLNFNVNQNIQQVIFLGSNLHLQYKINKSRFLAITDFSFVKAGKLDFVNTGYQHLRYNYRFNNFITLEAFTQVQYNRVLLLDNRYLAGAGPRLRLIKRKHIKMYLAGLYMYENQKRHNESIIQNNHRLSAYISFNLDFDRVDFASTTFFQPNLGNFSDYRIANDSSFELEITRHFNFKTGLNLLYDTRQPLNIPDLTYSIKNGITYKF